MCAPYNFAQQLKLHVIEHICAQWSTWKKKKKIFTKPSSNELFTSHAHPNLVARSYSLSHCEHTRTHKYRTWPSYCCRIVALGTMTIRKQNKYLSYVIYFTSTTTHCKCQLYMIIGLNQFSEQITYVANNSTYMFLCSLVLQAREANRYSTKLKNNFFEICWSFVVIPDKSTTKLD